MSHSLGGKCWYCEASLTPFDYGRADSCRNCGRDTRVCKGCVHYELGAHNDCRESQADRVVEKERSNFCDYFKPSDVRPGEQGKALKNSKQAIFSAAEALFKKKP